MKRNTLTLIVGIFLLFIVGLLLFVFQVRKSEVVVVTTFGKPTREYTQPGAYFRWPWGIQMVHRFDQRIQNFEDKVTEGLTSDSFNLLTSVYVGWRITQPTNFFPKFAGTSKPIAEAERVLERLLSNAKSAVVGKHPLSDFVSASDNNKSFIDIENEILASVQSQVRANNYGLDIEFLGIKKLQLPESVTQSVFERMTSERKVLADKSTFEGEAEAQKIRSDAERKAQEVLANAEGEATGIRAKGEAEAAKSLEVFQQNPELANFLFGLTALEGSLKERSILIFDQNTPPFNILRGVSTNLLHK
jgi:modulator of FtsH protease HflC